VACAGTVNRVKGADPTAKSDRAGLVRDSREGGQGSGVDLRVVMFALVVVVGGGFVPYRSRGRGGQPEDKDLLVRDAADVVIEADHLDIRDVLDHRFHERTN